MKTQFDFRKRVVSLENLRAMCERVSGVCHNYTVVKVSRSRVHVEYSNPTEYGTPQPMTAVFPCYPSGYEDDNQAVVLDIMRVIGDNWGGEGWQAFDCLIACPTLWRDPQTGKWETEKEIRDRQNLDT